MPIYLDNAATSFPKPESVYRAVDRALRGLGGNPGRGGHGFSLAAGRAVFETRESVAGFFGIADSSRVAFTSGATEAINLALFGLLCPGDRVVTTTMEHNAVTRPLRQLQERGVSVVKVAAGSDGRVDPADMMAACGDKTRLVVMSHCSNVTGTLQPVGEIGRWCRSRGILLLVDAAQSAGLFPLSVEDLGIDLLAVPGHKGLLGPPGTGCLYLRPGIKLRPLVFGGTGANSASDLPPEEMPERLESGTLNAPGLAGLQAGIEFLQTTGLEKLREHEQELLEQLIAGLKGMAGIRLYGPEDPRLHGGAVSFNVGSLDPSEVGFRLDHEYGICVRTGLHCAPDAHRTIGSHPRGTVRVSPGWFTTAGEIEQLLAALACLGRSD